MNKFKTFTALMLLLTIEFAGCGKSEAERHRLSKKEKARLDSLDRAALKIAVMPTMDCLPIFLACDDSIFQQQGVDVHLRRYTAQMDCDTAIERKRVESRDRSDSCSSYRETGYCFDVPYFYQSLLAVYHQ